jgi:hypothetical protein
LVVSNKLWGAVDLNKNVPIIVLDDFLVFKNTICHDFATKTSTGKISLKNALAFCGKKDIPIRSTISKFRLHIKGIVYSF